MANVRSDTRAVLGVVGEAEWSLFAKPFALEAVWIGWPNALGERLEAPGELAPEHLLTLARRVADALPRDGEPFRRFRFSLGSAFRSVWMRCRCALLALC
jgi:hypothetical protein